MRTSLSIPEIVREIITKHRSIYNCMKMDVINYSALAVKIQPEIEKILGRPVNFNTIVVAIKRYADSFETKEEMKEESILKNARLVLTDRILDVRFSTKDENGIDPGIILDRFSKITDNYDFFRLSDSIRLLTEDIDDVREIFSDVAEQSNMFNTGLAKIRISIPAGSQSDIVSYVAGILHAGGIEMVNAFFAQDSIVVILYDKDASRAYDILRSNIT